MTQPLDLQSETFSPTGNITSEGLRNQLGRPRLDRLALLMREAVQNAWDAKHPDSEQVTFGVVLRTLAKKQHRLLTDSVFASRPPPSATRGEGALTLDELLARDEMRVLTLFDRGTTGLGGPTRADRVENDLEPRDFVDFFRNVGQPPDKQRGGGTYGYGKTALYLASEAHTIIVHTRCTADGETHERLMVAALTDHYVVNRKRYTGRHWWGRLDSKFVEPLVGADARKLARALGLPVFSNDETGTSIAILAPRLEEFSPEDAMAYMTSHLLWNFWPKMVSRPDQSAPDMHFVADLEGENFVIPSPEVTPPFDSFARVLNRIRRAELTDEESKDVEVLQCLRPKRTLGRLCLEKFGQDRRDLANYGEDAVIPDVVKNCHHVALLRRPEFVVVYEPGPTLLTSMVGYAGVFLAADDMDRVYAQSEPPTHDAWQPENLATKSDRTFVNTTFRRIRESLDVFVRPPKHRYQTTDGPAVTALANHLGKLLTGAARVREVGATWAVGPESLPSVGTRGGAPESGVESRSGSGGGGSGRRRSARPNVVVHGNVELYYDQRTPLRVYTVVVEHAAGSEGTRIDARVFPVLAGGTAEDDAPAGAATARVHAWQAPDGSARAGTSSLQIDKSEAGTWRLMVAAPTEIMVGLDLKFEAVR